MLNTSQLRQLVHVYDIQERSEDISIRYWLGSKDKFLVVDKLKHENLMAFVDGPVSQWDAINIVVEFEQQKMLGNTLKTFY